MNAPDYPTGGSQSRPTGMTQSRSTGNFRGPVSTEVSYYSSERTAHDVSPPGLTTRLSNDSLAELSGTYK